MKTTMSAVLVLAALQSVLAAPTQTEYPEVIPGPGMPSLASLGLTSKQLYEMPLPENAAEILDKAYKLQKRQGFVGECGPQNSYTPVNGAIACYHYLNNLGHQSCNVPANPNDSVFCTAGSAEIIGYAPSGTNGPQSSYCSDVSLGVLWTINHCTLSDQYTAGFQAANGNGNLFVITQDQNSGPSDK